MKMFDSIHGFIKTLVVGGFGILLLGGCTTDEQNIQKEKTGTFSLTSSVEPFIGEQRTRLNLLRTDFEANDMIRMKVICPFTETRQLLESTDGGSYDAFWLLKWTGSSWGQVVSDSQHNVHFDIDGDLSDSNAPYIVGRTMGQQTPYVFTASTWSEEIRFLASGGGTAVVCFSNVFHADQSNYDDYHASDVLWAQQIMETACWNLHLTFQHKMAALQIIIDDQNAPVADFSKTSLTLEGMPDIDQQEIIIGDYYAAKSKVNSSYGYQQKNYCSNPADNGRVLGIGVNDKTEHKGKHAEFSTITETCSYTAYNTGNDKTFMLIVPPIDVPDGAALCFRNDNLRFKCPLKNAGVSILKDANDQSVTQFESGNLYKVKMTLPSPTP